MNRLSTRLAIAAALVSTIAVGGWVLLQRRGPAGLGRAAVLLPMVASTRSAIVDPAGMTIGSRFAPRTATRGSRENPGPMLIGSDRCR